MSSTEYFLGKVQWRASVMAVLSPCQLLSTNYISYLASNEVRDHGGVLKLTGEVTVYLKENSCLTQDSN